MAPKDLVSMGIFLVLEDFYCLKIIHRPSLNYELAIVVGMPGLEPGRLAAHDPKSCSSANSDTPPGDAVETLMMM